MLNLKDGTLWQWDTGRKLIVTLEEGEIIDKVQFYNGIGDSALPGTIETTEDGMILAGIPDALLQYSNNLTAYLMTTDEDGVKTTTSITLVVNARAKPENYVFTSGEILTYQKYNERLLEIENQILKNIIGPDKLNEAILKEVTTHLATKLSVDGTIPMRGSLLMGNNPIVGVATPVQGTDAANKVYVDERIDDEVLAHDVHTESHTDIRLLVKELGERLDALANSDDETLQQLGELVEYIEANKSLLDAVTTGKVNVSDIVDNLTTNVSDKPLSAKQGVVLKALIDAIVVPVTSVNGRTGAVNLGAFEVGAAEAAHTHAKADITNFGHTHTKSEISDFPTSMAPTSHKHTKSEITDFPTSMTPTAHTHTKSQISDFPASMTPTAHNQAASTITAGTFGGQVVANASGQAVGTSLLRNSKLVSTETNPTVNGEICWTYK